MLRASWKLDRCLLLLLVVRALPNRFWPAAQYCCFTSAAGLLLPPHTIAPTLIRFPLCYYYYSILYMEKCLVHKTSIQFLKRHS